MRLSQKKTVSLDLENWHGLLKIKEKTGASVRYVANKFLREKLEEYSQIIGSQDEEYRMEVQAKEKIQEMFRGEG